MNGPRCTCVRNCCCMLYFYVLVITQIVLESFPVSSSGHLQLWEKIFFAFPDFFSSSSSTSLLNYQAHDVLIVYRLLHGVTVITFVLFFLNRWFFLVMNAQRCWRIVFKCIALTVCADLCTTFFYYIIHFVYVVRLPLAVGFSITSALLLSLLWCPTDEKEGWTLKKSIIIGCMQGIALLPGISRMASTYVAARWLKIPARRSFEISCLIELPLIAAAFCVSLFFNINNPVMYNFFNSQMIFVIFIAGCLAYAALYLVAYIAQKERMYFFGFYMIIPMLLAWWFSY